MNIVLDHKILIDVKEGNKTKSKLSIFLREFTKQESLERSAVVKKFNGIYKKIKKIGRKQELFRDKKELLQLNKEYEKSLKVVDDLELIDKDIERLEDELTEIGGEDQSEFMEESAKNRFELVVSGNDKEKLAELAEIKGYLFIMQALDAEKVALEKKQSGK